MIDQASGLRELVSQKRGTNSKFIAIASGKGGVGKTNFALNYSYMLANRFDKKILLIDADINMANIHLFLQLQHSKNIKDLFAGESIETVLHHTFGFDSLIGFSGIDDIFELEKVSVNAVINQLENVSNQYDYVIIDTGAGIDEKVTAFVRSSHTSYIITTPEPTALMDAYALIKSVYKMYGYKNFKVVVNMCKNENEGITTFNKLQTSVNKFLGIDIALLGVLPFTPALRDAVKKKELIVRRYPKDAYSKQLYHICMEELKINDHTQGSMWKKFFDFMGKK